MQHVKIVYLCRNLKNSQENKPVNFKPTEKSKKWVRYEAFRNDPLLNPLGTPSGKIEIYSDVVAK